jgi:hypothetical protein
LGGQLIAWHLKDTVTVASRGTLTMLLQEPIAGVRELAVNDQWLLMRQLRPDGSTRLLAQSLHNTSRVRLLAHVPASAQLGRPALAGDTAVYSVASASGSSITAVNVLTGARQQLRASRQAQLLNPSLHDGSLLYSEISRCAQRLKLGRLNSGHERTLLTLPPLAAQDEGHEAGHPDQGAQTPCPGKLHPTRTLLWTTALTPTSAYVTLLDERRDGTTTPTLLRVRL